jgi:hypothetical protein
MKPLTEQILDLKTEAKNQRDRGLKGYPRALARLDAAIGLARSGLAATSVADAVRQLTKELADCYGMIGGVERRWGIEDDEAARVAHLSKSCIAYDEGYVHEWDSKHGTPATYNLVNRLTGRLLIRPDLLGLDEVVDLGHGVEPINLKQAMREAEALIARQLSSKGNFWAEADLALLQVLTGHAEPMSAYAPFVALSPPGFAFNSALDGLRPLASSTIASAPTLNAAIGLLTARRPTV